MNILSFIRFLNEENGWELCPDTYAEIDEWRRWWQGYYEPFHTLCAADADGVRRKRTLYRLRMPKKVCEDWASLLLNEKTSIQLADEASQKWLLGENQSGGLLQTLSFWRCANELVEQAFYSGTGAFVLLVEGMQCAENGAILVSPNARLHLDYLPAQYILPVTVRYGRVVDCAFVSELFVGGKSQIYLQLHRLEEGGYTIENRFFQSLDNREQEAYAELPTPSGMSRRIRTGSEIPWFSLLRPNLLKNREGGEGLGMSIFAEALDAAKGVDKAFNNFVKDIELGAKKVFYDRSMVRTVVREDGTAVTLTPDDLQNQLFMQMTDGDSLNPSTEPIHEYNPSLRAAENQLAVQEALNLFSFKTGLGTHHYVFDGQSVATATQYSGDRQDLRQNAQKHQILVEEALQGVVRTLLWAGKTILGQPVDPDTQVTVSFDDGFFTDTESLRQLEAQDVRDGILPAWCYLMKYYDKSEEEAKSLAKEAAGTPEAETLFGGDLA